MYRTGNRTDSASNYPDVDAKLRRERALYAAQRMFVEADPERKAHVTRGKTHLASGLIAATTVRSDPVQPTLGAAQRLKPAV